MKIELIGADAPVIEDILKQQGFRNVRGTECVNDAAYDTDSLIILLAGYGIDENSVPEAHWVIRTEGLTPEEAAFLCSQYICSSESAAHVAHKLRRSRRLDNAEAAKQRDLQKARAAIREDGRGCAKLKLRLAENYGSYVTRKRSSRSDQTVKSLTTRRMRREGKRMASLSEEMDGSIRSRSRRHIDSSAWRRVR